MNATSRFAVLLLLAIYSLSAPSARAELVVSPGFPIPLLAGDVTQERWRSSLSAIAGGLDDHDDTLATVEVNEPLTASPAGVSYASQYGPFYGYRLNVANAGAHGSVGNGSITGYANARAAIGPATAQAQIILDFVDQVHITETGVPQISMELSGTAEAQHKNANVFSSSSGIAEVFVFPASYPLLPAGSIFNATFHEQTTISAFGNTHTITPNFDTVFNAGTDWWVVGRLEVNAIANVSIMSIFGKDDPGDVQSVTGDFSHTAVLHIDASPGTPDFAYTTASGVDYHTTPEPSTGILAAVGAAFLLRMRVRKS